MGGQRWIVSAFCVVSIAALPCAAIPTAVDAPKPNLKTDVKSDPHADALKAKGLARSGNVIVLAGEAEVLEQMKALRQDRKQAERETQQRKRAEDKIAANQKFIRDSIKDLKESEKRLPKMKDVNLHNRLVTRMNALSARVKEAIDSQKDLEEEANKVPNTGKTKFVEGLVAVAPKVEALTAKYKEAAADSGVKALVAKVNAGGGPKATFGPSPDFSRAVDEVATWRSQIESEAIPLRETQGVHSVEVAVNGESMHMLLDTGASHVTLPHEVAEKLKITPTEQDPTVKMKLANGSIIEGKLITLKDVRVGRFTVNNVGCVVLQAGLSDPPTILGNSFLSHFVVKMSASTRELHLTEVGSGGGGSGGDTTTAKPGGSGA